MFRSPRTKQPLLACFKRVGFATNNNNASKQAEEALAKLTELHQQKEDEQQHQQQQRTWRDRFATQEERTRMWKILSSAAIAMAVGRYYYAWYTHGLELEALRDKAKELDAEKAALDAVRIGAVSEELAKLRFSEAERAESLRVLRAVAVESADVERAIDAHIVVINDDAPDSAAADNERGRL
jgi:hypothetical protein